MRGDGPVGEAQYRRGPQLGHQVAEGREESPQLRCPRQQIQAATAFCVPAVPLPMATGCPAFQPRTRSCAQGPDGKRVRASCGSGGRGPARPQPSHGD